jgi:pimeloyl-ACP methyl ester carboxylesterase
MVAAAMALDHKESVSKLVLIGGYFFPSARVDSLLMAPPAIPVVGDVMRYTVSPLIGSAMLPLLNNKIFDPAPVPERWTEEFPLAMTLRPSQIRAEAAEAAIMVPAAAAMAPRLGEIAIPVTIIAGEGDAVVTMEAQSARLGDVLANSKLVTIAGAGHMVHHTASDRVAAAIEAA